MAGHFRDCGCIWCPRRRRLKFLLALGAVVLLLVITTFVKEPQLYFEDFNDVMIPLKSKHRNQEEYIDKRGIHVVVGHYVGDDIPGRSKPNLTDELLNTNDFSPREDYGKNGMPVTIPNYDTARMKLLYNINHFNLLASDRIPLNRTLPDVRKKECRSKANPVENLPSTSVIIVFHNEAWSTLLRTVHSVMNRSPKTLLTEIILVDDASERTFLMKPLEDHISSLPVSVKLIRTGNRTGLIRARLLGANEAKGQILTFLDAHCEVTEGWLQPLVERIAGDNTRVACPIIDIIDESSFQYVRAFELHWGAFNWNLHYRWYAVGPEQLRQRKQDPTQVYRSPAMAGGLFSIDKDFFFHIGAYDDQMDIWGGENLEMSFRVWMCGGSVELVPCSHVGHVFRKSSPYSFPGEGGVGGILYRNLARVALVWMDEWANFYFSMNAEAERASKSVSVKERLLLRKRLGCHDFEWYLNNVWKEHFFPSHDRVFGKIRNVASGKCIQRPQSPGGSIHPSGPSALKDCVIERYPAQSFVFTKKGFIMTDESVCLDSPDATTTPFIPQVRLIPCHAVESQIWTYDDSKRSLRHVASGRCLDRPSIDYPDTLSLQKCENSKSQQWIFEHEKWQELR